MRKENDSIGDIYVDENVFWGAQTQRSIENFGISSEIMPNEIAHAFGIQKKAAMMANFKLGKLDAKVFEAMQEGVNKIINGELYDQFPLHVWQTGSGTQTNMNANEVIAGYANFVLSGMKGGKSPVHPNDHCNMHQSSNDTFPTVMHIAAYLKAQEVLKSLNYFIACFTSLRDKYAKVIKIGRTHMMDAVPVTFFQVFDSFIGQLENCKENIIYTSNKLTALPQGGTASGSGINCPKEFPEYFVSYVNEITGKNCFSTSDRKYSLMAAHDLFADYSSALNTCAVVLMKVAQDFKFMASGPRCGIYEVSMPMNEPGSSIMPGKVNPTQMEALSMISAYVMGLHNTVTISASYGHCELNVFKPVIAFCVIQASNLMIDVMRNTVDKCFKGVTVNEDNVADILVKSLMLVTPISKLIGYDKAAKLAKYAFEKNISLKEANNVLQFVPQDEFDSIVDPKSMV